ncbi:unnamed protein product [Amoebophrya sp. A25]|nr:unnamed protein product [Amoebophrya sp. A25]|eukprot:GSA25T00023228001.1
MSPTALLVIVSSLFLFVDHYRFLQHAVSFDSFAPMRMPKKHWKDLDILECTRSRTRSPTIIYGSLTESRYSPFCRESKFFQADTRQNYFPKNEEIYRLRMLNMDMICSLIEKSKESKCSFVFRETT